MRRRKHNEAFSLFSFQDIITSVTGILVLLTLFLALRLTQPETYRPRTTADDSTTKLNKSISEIDLQIRQLRQTLDNGRAFLTEFAGLSPTALATQEQDLTQGTAAVRTDLSRLTSDISDLEQARSAAPDDDVSSSRADLSTIEREVTALQRRLNDLKRTHHLVYNVAPGATKNAWLVDIAPESIMVFRPKAEGTQITFKDKAGASSCDQFLAWARGQHTDQDYFVLLVRPKSLTLYRTLYESLNDLHYAIGVDLIQQEATLEILFDNGQQQE